MCTYVCVHMYVYMRMYVHAFCTCVGTCMRVRAVYYVWMTYAGVLRLFDSKELCELPHKVVAQQQFSLNVCMRRASVCACVHARGSVCMCECVRVCVCYYYLAEYEDDKGG